MTRFISDYSDHGTNIAEAFQNYLRTGDEKCIEKYSVKELKTAISLLSPYYNTNQQWYRQIERRIGELEHAQQTGPTREAGGRGRLMEKWLTPAAAFFLGIVLGSLLR